jgi:hypothetical protein
MSRKMSADGLGRTPGFTPSVRRHVTSLIIGFHFDESAFERVVDSLKQDGAAAGWLHAPELKERGCRDFHFAGHGVESGAAEPTGPFTVFVNDALPESASVYLLRAQNRLIPFHTSAARIVLFGNGVGALSVEIQLNCERGGGRPGSRNGIVFENRSRVIPVLAQEKTDSGFRLDTAEGAIAIAESGFHPRVWTQLVEAVGDGPALRIHMKGPTVTRLDISVQDVGGRGLSFPYTSPGLKEIEATSLRVVRHTKKVKIRDADGREQVKRESGPPVFRIGHHLFDKEKAVELGRGELGQTPPPFLVHAAEPNRPEVPRLPGVRDHDADRQRLLIRYEGRKPTRESFVSMALHLPHGRAEVLDLNRVVNYLGRFDEDENLLCLWDPAANEFMPLKLGDLVQPLLEPVETICRPDNMLANHPVLLSTVTISGRREENEDFVQRFVNGRSSQGVRVELDPIVVRISDNMTWGFRRGLVGLVGFVPEGEKSEWLENALYGDEYLRQYFTVLLVLQQWITLYMIDRGLSQLDFVGTQLAPTEMKAFDRARRLYLDFMARANLKALTEIPMKEIFYNRVREAFGVRAMAEDVTVMMDRIGQQIDHAYAEMSQQANERMLDARARTERTWKYVGYMATSFLVPATGWGTFLGLNIKEANAGAGMFSLTDPLVLPMPLWATIGLTFLICALVELVLLWMWYRGRPDGPSSGDALPSPD